MAKQKEIPTTNTNSKPEKLVLYDDNPMYIGKKSGCGLGSCTPSWLQCCSDIRAFTGFYSLAGMLSQALGYYMISQITTVEKQLGLSSTQSGFLLSANDIGYLVVVLIASHLGRNTHRPVVLGVLALVFGALAFIGASPHFIMSSYDPKLFFVSNDVANRHLCDRNMSNVTSLTNVSSHGNGDLDTIMYVRRLSFGLLTLAFICQGAVKAPRIALSTTYIDDHVRTLKSGIYLGVVSTVITVGVVLAFGVGATFSNIYVTLQGTNMTPKDPRWVGAWWLGFVIIGTLAVLAGLPLICFPKKLRQPVESVEYGTSNDDFHRETNVTGLKNTSVEESNNRTCDSVQDQNSSSKSVELQEWNDKFDCSPDEIDCDHKISHFSLDNQPADHVLAKMPQNRRKKKSDDAVQMSRSGRTDSIVSALSNMIPKTKTFQEEMRDFPRALQRLLRNPVYMCMLLGDSMLTMVAQGRVSYQPKYLENYFTIVSSRANMLFGITMILGACLGTMTGGAAISCFKLSARGCIGWLVVTGLAAHTLILASAAVKCEQAMFHGFDMNTLLRREQGTVQPSIPCSDVDGCLCNNDKFLPVCGDDGRNYFSPCHAGCTASHKSIFFNCSCISLISTNVTIRQTNNVETYGYTAIPGYCPSKCGGLAIYLVIGFTYSFLGLSGVVPRLVVSIRIVNEKDRSLAVGMNAFSLTLFGAFLSPILFGAIIDSCCVLWRGSCQLYDIDDLRIKYHLYLGWIGYVPVMMHAISLCLITCTKYAALLDESNTITVQDKPRIDIEKNKKRTSGYHENTAFDGDNLNEETFNTPL